MVKRGPNLGNVPSLDWRTWGQQKVLTIKAGDRFSDYQQVINVSHSHPESWRFFLMATPLQVPSADLQCGFGLIIGNGLTVGQIQPITGALIDDTSFVYFNWTGILKPPKWTSKALAPIGDDDLPNVRSEIETIPAQSFQIGAIIRLAAPEPTDVSVSIFASVSPNVFGDNRKAFQALDGGWHPPVEPEEAGFSEEDYDDEEEEGPY